MKFKFFDWTLFEFLLFSIGMVLTAIIGIVFSSDWLTISYTLIGIVNAMLLAKGKVLGQFLGLVIVVLYSIISYRNAYYGEIIIYVTMMLPLYIISIISWIKHRTKEEKSIVVNEIKTKEWVFVGIVTVCLFIAFYFILKALNTSQLFISTFSIIDSAFVVYLLARRSRVGFLSCIINDIVLITLWGIPIIQGNLTLLPMILVSVVGMTFDAYGWVHWGKLRKKQKSHEGKEVNAESITTREKGGIAVS